jgi:hypothetical protein
VQLLQRAQSSRGSCSRQPQPIAPIARVISAVRRCPAGPQHPPLVRLVLVPRQEPRAQHTLAAVIHHHCCCLALCRACQAALINRKLSTRVI